MSGRSDSRGGRVGCIVLAAGEGRRFGGPKQIATLAGRPLLEHVLATAAKANLEPFVVVLGAQAERVIREVPLHGAQPVICEDWRAGQAGSLRAGIEALGEVDAAVIALGDQPLLSVEAIERVMARREPGAIAVRATYGGEPGHPVVLERAALAQAEKLSGDRGARQLFAGAQIREVACDDIGAAIDVDTPDDLAALE